jgi:hypothetical protein
MNIQEIKDDGFIINQTKPKIENLAFLSLKIALKSYFLTYKSEASNIRFLKDEQLSALEKDSHYTVNYIENACEAISHFHHFVELLIKDILRKEHVLLSIDASKKHDLLFDLLFNKNYDDKALENVKQLEFSEALGRLIALIKMDKLDKTKYDFFVKAEVWLKVLNSLRNRIAHRGIFVIRYKALDFLFGKYAFPFVENILALVEYNKKANWKYQVNYVNINPINEIIQHFKSESYSIQKVSLLKEIGRASFENPLYLNTPILEHYNKEHRAKAESFANSILKLENIDNVVQCPICGAKSLVLYEDFYDDRDEDTGIVNEAYCFIYKVKCFCCSFELDNNLEDLDKMKLNIENYWIIKE